MASAIGVGSEGNGATDGRAGLGLSHAGGEVGGALANEGAHETELACLGLGDVHDDRTANGGFARHVQLRIPADEDQDLVTRQGVIAAEEGATFDHERTRVGRRYHPPTVRARHRHIQSWRTRWIS